MVVKWVEIGEALKQASNDPKFKHHSDFDAWLKEKQFKGIGSYRQASKYIAIAHHKWQALEDTRENDSILSIDNLSKHLPSVTETPVTPKSSGVAKAAVLHEIQSKGDIRKVVNEDVKNTWRTPLPYIESARATMGSIELDPYSSIEANNTVKAERFFTIVDDAEQQTWSADTVWMNPPYGRGVMNKAIDKFCLEYDDGHFISAIVMTNNSTDTRWFHDLLDRADAICMTLGRVAFLGANGEPVDNNMTGQVFFYFGEDTDKFDEFFAPYGTVVII